MRTTIYYTVGKERKSETFDTLIPLRTLFEKVSALGGDPQNFEFTRAGGYCTGHYQVKDGELIGVFPPRFVASNIVCKD